MRQRSTDAPRKASASGKAAAPTLPQIADRLHNTVCQSITGASMLLSVVRQQLPADAANLRQQLDDIDAVLEKSCTELRALIHELRTAAAKDPAA